MKISTSCVALYSLLLVHPIAIWYLTHHYFGWNPSFQGYSPYTKNSTAEGLLGQRKGKYLSCYMKGRPGPCESWNEAEFWKLWKVSETQELHANGPNIITTLPKHKPMKSNILILKISSLGCLCMPFLLACFGRVVEKAAERQSSICMLLTSRWHGGPKEQHYTAFPSPSRFSNMKNQPEAPPLLFQKPKKSVGPQGMCSTTTAMSHWRWMCQCKGDDASKRRGAWGSVKHRVLKL